MTQNSSLHRKPVTFRLILCITFVIFLGCASYTTIPAPEMTAMPMRHATDAILMGIDPWSEKERQAIAFHADLSERGVLPIQLLVQNKGTKAYWVRPTEMTLEFSDGTQVRPIDVFTVAYLLSNKADIEESTILTPRPEPMWGLGPQAGAAAAFGAIVIGAGSFAIAELSARDPRLPDYMAKELKGSVLTENQAIHGFIFFYVPKNKRSERADLLLRINNMIDETNVAVRVPLSSLGVRRESPTTEKNLENSAPLE